jgi:hypothetical protein
MPSLPDDSYRELSMQLDDSQVDRILFGKIISRYAVLGIVQRAATNVSSELLQSAVAFLRAECEAFQNERNTRFRSRFIA